MRPAIKPLPEWRDVDAKTFETQIRPGARPAVLRNLVGQWPAVKSAQSGAGNISAYLLSMYANVPVPLFEVPAEMNGRLFYDTQLNGFNFRSSRAPLGAIISRLMELRDQPKVPALYSGSISLPIYLPSFIDGNPLPIPLRSEATLQSIWIGNRTRVAAHFDASENIACVVAGRRRFTLFAPEQVANLYVGPLDRTPAGQPISLVDLAAPDLDRFPRFAQALEQAQSAELGPGDAIYIPTLWWHAVDGLDAFNVLVNYWWQDTPAYFEPPMQSLLHCLLSIKGLPAAQRSAWKALFDYLIFQDGTALEHLSAQQRGLFGDLTSEKASIIRAMLLERLSRDG